MITADTKPQLLNRFDKTVNIAVRIVSLNTRGVRRSDAFIKYELNHPTPKKFISRMFNSTTLLAIDDDTHMPIPRFEVTLKN